MKNFTAASIVKRILDSRPPQSKNLTRVTDSSKRRALAKDWNISGLPPGTRQSAKRAIENVIRKDKKYNPSRAEIGPDDMVLLLRDKRSSKVLDALYPERRQDGHWLRLKDRDRTVSDKEIDLRNFSFLENPKDTLKSIRELAEAEAKCLGAKIHFKDSYCLDVAPFMVLVECWKEMLPVFEGGEMDLPMQKVLASVGVGHALGISFAGISDFEDVWSFPLSRRRNAGSTLSKSPYVDVPTRDYATDRFCEAMDEWLGRPEIGLELSDNGRVQIMNLLGEVLENAERHSDGLRRDGSWSVSGFLARRQIGDDQRWTYRASIGILSIGDTFSESLDRAHPNQKENINKYVAEVRKRGAIQSDATLRTLAALQDTVTCVEEAEDGDRGGYGLMDMLDFVCGLGQTDQTHQLPQVTIISGSSCIRLKDAYNSGVAQTADFSPRVQWFNKENSAKVPPDVEYVFDLDAHLPGTVISIGFSLDPSFLSKVFESD